MKINLQNRTRRELADHIGETLEQFHVIWESQPVTIRLATAFWNVTER